MLAYRHAFHAGNHADVLKHIVLLRLLRHMNLKDKAYRVVDTHAGAGLYRLDSAQAMKNREYWQGIQRLWTRDDLPEPVADYVQFVRRLNEDGSLRHYPGSPWLAQAVLRAQDHLRLFELHPADHLALQAALGAAARCRYPSGRRLRRAQGPAAAAVAARGGADRPQLRRPGRLRPRAGHTARGDPSASPKAFTWSGIRWCRSPVRRRWCGA